VHAPADAQRVTIKIDVPKPGASSSKRHGLYVSPATTQMAIDIRQGGTSITGYPTTVALTPTSGGCTSSLASTTCQLVVSLGPGSYVGTFTTEDAGGTALSTAQSIPITVVAGTNNVVAITLSGVPVAIGAYVLQPTQPTIILNALDADNNVIVGSGAPTFTIARTGGAPVTLTQPTSASPNVFTAVMTGAATLNVTANFSADGSSGICTQAGAKCTATFALASTPQPSTIFVLNPSPAGVAVFPPPYTGTPTTITSGLIYPGAITTDSSGNLYVTDVGVNAVLVYAPPYTSAPVASITNGINYPADAHFDAVGNLFVANFGGQNVTEYAPPYTGAPIATIATDLYPSSIALDAADDLFVVANQATVTEYRAPYTGAPVTVTNGLASPQQALVGPDGTLFVYNTSPIGVLAYAKPYTGAPTVVQDRTFAPTSMAVAPNGDLFVADGYGSQNVLAFQAPYTASSLVLSSASAPMYAVTVGGDGTAFVGEGTSLVARAMPYTGATTVVPNAYSSAAGDTLWATHTSVMTITPQ
jgi:hypothetical protein